MTDISQTPANNSTAEDAVPNAQGAKAPKANWLDDGARPCDPAIFLETLGVWEAAQQVPLRSERPQGPGYVLADIPINRAGMAVVKLLRERGVPHPQAYLIRLMHLSEVFDDIARGGALAKYVKPGEEPKTVLVNEALLTAVALAPISVPANLAKAKGMLNLEAIRVLAESASEDEEEATNAD